MPGLIEAGHQTSIALDLLPRRSSEPPSIRFIVNPNTINAETKGTPEMASSRLLHSLQRHLLAPEIAGPNIIENLMREKELRSPVSGSREHMATETIVGRKEEQFHLVTSSLLSMREV